ncbi:MAG: hypothetical protein IIZ33_03490 [Erysipelotrichaceae bacterium]|nr:hypothetical protein [Erysipelotrichaceae bacterium]
MNQLKKFMTVLLVLILFLTVYNRPAFAEEDRNDEYIRLFLEAEEEIREVEEEIAKGSLGFFLWHDPDSPAAAIIEERLENQAYDSWGDIELGVKGDATSLDNMYTAILFIQEGNAIRANDGYGETYPLMISDELMAVSQIQTTNSARIMAHSRMYGVTENLAWGYSDPFSVWYNEEKASWLSGVRGWDVAHFENLINPGGMYSARISTGFGMTTRGTVYGATHGQVFGTAANFPDAKLYTAEEYLEDFNTYRDGLNERMEKAKKQREEALSRIAPVITSLANSEKGTEILFKKITGIEEYVILRDSGRGFEEIARVKTEDLSDHGLYFRYCDEETSAAFGHSFHYAVKAVVEGEESSYEEKKITRVRSITVSSISWMSNSSVSVNADLGSLNGFEVRYSEDGENWLSQESVYPYALITGLDKAKTYQFRVRGYLETEEGRFWSAFTEYKGKIGDLTVTPDSK